MALEQILASLPLSFRFPLSFPPLLLAFIPFLPVSGVQDCRHDIRTRFSMFGNAY